MTDEQITALLDEVTQSVKNRPMDAPLTATESIFAGTWPNVRAHIDALGAENATLKALVRGWHYLAVGPDEMGDYHTHRALIKASEPYAHPSLKVIAQETQP